MAGKSIVRETVADLKMAASEWELAIDAAIRFGSADFESAKRAAKLDMLAHIDLAIQFGLRITERYDR